MNYEFMYKLFFEIEQEDGDRKYGKSKEHHPNPIIQMGMFMDGDGLPLAFLLFPGNANEQTSLKSQISTIIWTQRKSKMKHFMMECMQLLLICWMMM